MLFRKGIQEKHIDFLSKNKSVLITDYEEVVTKKSGEVTYCSTLFAIFLRDIRDEWIWDFDLRGHERINSRRVIKMVALTF